MSKESSQSSVCFSLNQENDDPSERTELTVIWPYYDDDLSQEDEFGIHQGADPYLDGSHPSQTEKQELLDLKLRIIRQQEKLDILSSKLSQCEAENEALKAEKAVLVDELARAHGATQEQHITRRGWFSNAGDNVGSMQLLIDTNSKPMTDKARLQVMVDVLRKPFQIIKDSRRGTAKIILESSFTDKNQEELPIDSSQHSIQDSILTNSLNLIPEQEKFGTSGDDCIIEDDNGVISKRAACERRAARERAVHINSMLRESMLSKELKKTFDKGAACCKPADLLVEFGETERRRPRRTDGRLCHSLTEGTACRKSENLLVDFGGTRRARSMAVAGMWTSLKL